MALSACRNAARTRFCRLVPAAFAAFASAGVNAEPVSLNISSQPLEQALLQFAAQAHLELIYPAELARGRQGPPLQGKYEVDEALRSLLDASGLDFRRIDEHTLTLFARPAANLPPVSSLEPVLVTAKAAAGGNDAAGGRYRLESLSAATGSDVALPHLPQSAHVIGQNLLHDQQTVNLSDSLVNVSGVAPRNPLFTPVTEGTMIRGFRTEQFLDGFNQYYNSGDREGWINVERVEVLKGPNGLQYGGGAGTPASGGIYVISKQPKPNVFLTTGVKTGSYNFIQPYIDANRPLSDTIWLRLTGEFTYANSFVNVIDTRRFNLNPSLAVNFNSAVHLTLQGKVSDWRQPEYQGLPATGTLSGDFRLPNNLFIGPSDIPDSQTQGKSVWTTLDWQLGAVWSAKLQARYAEATQAEYTQSLVGAGLSLVGDLPYAPPAKWLLANAALAERQHELDIRGQALAKFNWLGGQHELQLGGDHSNQTDTGYLQFNPAGAVNLLNPVFNVPYQAPLPPHGDQRTGSQIVGGYVQWRADIARLHPLLGGRLGEVDINYFNPNPAAYYRTRETRWLPRAGLSLDISPELSLFTGYSQGVRGLPFLALAGKPMPELSSQWEGGLKFDFHKTLSGQVAVYRIDVSRAPVAVNASNTVFASLGQQRSAGYEADLSWRPLAELNLIANYANCDARFSDSHYLALAGNHLPWAPQQSGRVWLEYQVPAAAWRGLNLGFGVYASSGAYLANDNHFKTPAYHTFDASIAYQTGALNLSASAKNLTSEHYYLPFSYLGSDAAGGGRVSPAAGAAFYLNLAYGF